jgi:dynein heavy chain
MFTNVINASFEAISTVAEGAVLVETFFLLAKRETVKRCVERKASELQQMFLKQIQSVRAEFENGRQKCTHVWTSTHGNC